MSKRTPPESIAWLHHAAAAGQADARLMLTMLERIEALEQRPIAGTVELAAPTLEAAPLATDDELLELATERFPDGFRACYNLGREHGAAAARCPHVRTSDEGSAWCELAEQTAATPPAPPAAPAGGLVERICSRVPVNRAYVPHVICQVAAWLRDGRHMNAAELLEEEADR